jgi:hypothetical protein
MLSERYTEELTKILEVVKIFFDAYGTLEDYVIYAGDSTELKRLSDKKLADILDTFNKELVNIKISLDKLILLNDNVEEYEQNNF